MEILTIMSSFWIFFQDQMLIPIITLLLGGFGLWINNLFKSKRDKRREEAEVSAVELSTDEQASSVINKTVANSIDTVNMLEERIKKLQEDVLQLSKELNQVKLDLIDSNSKLQICNKQVDSNKINIDKLVTFIKINHPDMDINTILC